MVYQNSPDDQKGYVFALKNILHLENFVYTLYKRDKNSPEKIN